MDQSKASKVYLKYNEYPYAQPWQTVIRDNFLLHSKKITQLFWLVVIFVKCTSCIAGTCSEALELDFGLFYPGDIYILKKCSDFLKCVVYIIFN